jgi:hypothetical protein
MGFRSALLAIPQRYGALVKQFGVAVSALYVLDRLLRRLSGGFVRVVAYALYAQPIGAATRASVRDDAHTTVSKVAPSDLVIAAFPRPAEVIRRRFAGGSCCYVAQVKDKFAGFIWISRDRYEEDEVRCLYVLSVPDVSAWDFDVYVEPTLRLGRTLARLWKHVDASLAADGIKWSFSRISIFNTASVRAHQRLGAVKVGRASFLLLGPLQLALLSSRPFVHLSARPGHGPRIHLHPPHRGV